MVHKDLWDLESAMTVLSSETVDSKLWAEAVEWLIMYGPPEIQKLLLDASASAIENSFPDLKPSHYTNDGQPVYDIKGLAQSLDIKESEVREILAKKNLEHQLFPELDDDDSSTIH